MRLSAPIYRLRRRAKRLARQEAIRLHEALDRLAAGEGFRSWSHLMASSSTNSPADAVISKLVPGDMVLIGARPGQGKTLLGLELVARAERLGMSGFVFTLDDNESDVAARFAQLGYGRPSAADRVVVDTSDEISAGYIIARLERFGAPAMIVIDYLQVLDQKRAHPGLDDQIRSLKAYVADNEAICLVISQIDRSFDLSGKAMPDLSDIRLPNPLDLSVFDRTCFLNNGEVRMNAAA